MAFKYTCILLLVSMVFLLAQAKNDKKENTKQHDRQKFKKRYDWIVYKGERYDCNDHLTIDEYGNGCSCTFVACTGSQQCTSLGGLFCAFQHTNVDVTNMTREDCKCDFLK